MLSRRFPKSEAADIFWYVLCSFTSASVERVTRGSFQNERTEERSSACHRMLVGKGDLFWSKFTQIGAAESSCLVPLEDSEPPDWKKSKKWQRHQ